MKKVKVAVIIPTYNEKDNIDKIIPEISDIFIRNSIKGKIFIVDDNSPDGTGQIADKLSKKYPVLVIHRTKNRGYGASTIEGFKTALNKNFDIIITMDCDFSHNPEIIPKLIENIKKGDQLVIGSRRIPGGKIIGWNAWRHFCSFGATNFSKIMLGIKAKDITSGYRAYDSKFLIKIPFQDIKSNGYSFLEELLYLAQKNKLKISEVPIIFVDRKYGKSKLSKKEILKFFITIIGLKFKN